MNRHRMRLPTLAKQCQPGASFSGWHAVLCLACSPGQKITQPAANLRLAFNSQIWRLAFNLGGITMKACVVGFPGLVSSSSRDQKRSV